MEYQKHPISIVEDNQDFKLAIKTFIDNSKFFYVNNTYSSCEDLVKNIKNENAKIVLMDIDLPGLNGVEGTKIVKKELPKTDVIIVTIFENSETVFSALRAGASGYLTKTLTEQDLINALQECIDGGAPMSMKIANMVVKSFKKNTSSPLTDRETEVLSCLANGMSYNSTGDKLFISKDTVKYHIKNIYIKLQVNSKEEAIKIANKENYI